MDLVLSFSKPIACILCVLLTLSFLFVKFLMWITGSSIAGIGGILVILYAIYKLLRQVGTFALYPGSVSYIKADYQIRGSQRLIQIIIKSLQQFFGLIYKCQQHADTAYLTKIYLNTHIKQTIHMLTKFQDSLSDKKKQLLRTYRNIDAIISSVYKIQDISFIHEQFIQNPNKIRQMLFNKFKNNSQLKIFTQQFGKNISIYATKINYILNQLTPSQQTQRDTLKMSIYRLYSQKLYQIRFAFLYWDPKFQYSIHLVSSKNITLQCAVIQGPKNNPIQDNKCVIISCPNGAYAQYFALQSQYISMYLQMGYKIVLWNYRGYGQSTGDPTISICIQDVQQIYKYAKTALQLDPQISHGYSIGGPPAAYLAYKNPFKILIIDRSFCNFVNIAHEISPFLAKLARIVMKDDSNVNISQIYMKIKNCNKILIWSAVDEIVSNGSSLKLGILKRISVQLQIKQILKTNSPVSIISEAQLSQKVQFIEKKNKLRNQNTLQNWLQKLQQFFQMISSLHEAEKLQQNSNSTFILNSSKQCLSDQPLMQQSSQLKSFTTNSQIIQRKYKVKEILSNFWKIVGQIDGGGTQMKFLHQLAEGGFKKSSQLHIQIKSFVLGLIYFGSCYHQGDKLNKDNLDNLSQTIISLTNADKQLQNFIKQNELACPVRLMEYIKLFHSILNEMRNHLQKLGRIQNGLGLVVPTQSGHNGDLTKSQMQYLKAIIQSTKNNLQERNCLGFTQINQ